MLITSIRRKGANVEYSFEDGRVIVICYDTAFKSGLRKNDDISEGRINQLLTDSEFFRVKKAAFRIISRRHHSRYEIYLKLIKKKFAGELVNKVLDDLTAKNYINDSEFAELFIRQALEQKKTGLMKIRNSLLKRGVNKEIIDAVIGRHSDDSDLLDSALKLSDRKLKILREKNSDKQILKRKIYAFLINRGFSHDICSEVISRISGESDDFD